MKTDEIKYNKLVVHKHLSAKEEYNLLLPKEREFVDGIVGVMKKHKRKVGSLRMVECLKRAIDLLV